MGVIQTSGEQSNVPFAPILKRGDGVKRARDIIQYHRDGALPFSPLQFQTNIKID